MRLESASLQFFLVFPAKLRRLEQRANPGEEAVSTR
jgi:hypothetical protein